MTSRNDDDGPLSCTDLTDETLVLTRRRMEAAVPGPAGHITVDPLPPGPLPHLEVIEGRDRGARFDIRKPMVIIGRLEGVADLVVDDDTISRHHAVIGYQDGDFVIYDLGSTNSTCVNGERITKAALTEGAEIRIGDTVLAFRR